MRMLQMPNDFAAALGGGYAPIGTPQIGPGGIKPIPGAPPAGPIATPQPTQPGGIGLVGDGGDQGVDPLAGSFGFGQGGLPPFAQPTGPAPIDPITGKPIYAPVQGAMFPGFDSGQIGDVDGTPLLDGGARRGLLPGADSGPPSGAPGAQPASSGNAFLDSLFGSPEALAAGGPQPYSAFGDIPFINPTFTAPGQVDPAQLGEMPFAQTNLDAIGSDPLARVAPVGNARAALTGPTPTMRAAQVGGAPGMHAQLVDPASAQGFTDEFTRAIESSMQPAFGRQREQLNESLAGRGIFNSTAGAQLQNDLAGQQDSALAGAEAPIFEQGFGAAQQDATINQGARQSAEATNVGNLFTSALTDAQLRQQAAGTNVGTAEQNVLANQGARNSATAQSFAARLAEAQQQASLQQGAFDRTFDTRATALGQNTADRQQAFGTTFGARSSALSQNATQADAANRFNATAANEATSGNAAAYLGTTTSDQAQFNNYLQELLGLGSSYGGSILSNYLSSFAPNNAASGILGTGLSNAGSAYTGAYNSAISNGGAFASALAQIFRGGGGSGYAAPPPDPAFGVAGKA